MEYVFGFLLPTVIIHNINLLRSHQSQLNMHSTVRHCSTCFTDISLFLLQRTLWGCYYYCSHFISGGTEAQSVRGLPNWNQDLNQLCVLNYCVMCP